MGALAKYLAPSLSFSDISNKVDEDGKTEAKARNRQQHAKKQHQESVSGKSVLSLCQQLLKPAADRRRLVLYLDSFLCTQGKKKSSSQKGTDRRGCNKARQA